MLSTVGFTGDSRKCSVNRVLGFPELQWFDGFSGDSRKCSVNRFLGLPELQWFDGIADDSRKRGNPFTNSFQWVFGCDVIDVGGGNLKFAYGVVGIDGGDDPGIGQGDS